MTEQPPRIDRRPIGFRRPSAITPTSPDAPDELNCPRCGALMECATAATFAGDADDAPEEMSPGDISICAYCDQVLTMLPPGSGRRFGAMTEKEIGELPPEAHRLLRHMAAGAMELRQRGEAARCIKEFGSRLSSPELRAAFKDAVRDGLRHAASDPLGTSEPVPVAGLPGVRVIVVRHPSGETPQ